MRRARTRRAGSRLHVRAARASASGYVDCGMLVGIPKGKLPVDVALEDARKPFAAGDLVTM